LLRFSVRRPSCFRLSRPIPVPIEHHKVDIRQITTGHHRVDTIVNILHCPPVGGIGPGAR
jgi:hypothetical protein